MLADVLGTYIFHKNIYECIGFYDDISEDVIVVCYGVPNYHLNAKQLVFQVTVCNEIFFYLSPKNFTLVLSQNKFFFHLVDTFLGGSLSSSLL